MKPRGLCNLDGCVYLAGHRCDHSWNRPYSTRVAEPTVDDAALSPDISATTFTHNRKD